MRCFFTTEPVRAGDWTVTGSARLDNRDEVRGWTAAALTSSDLDLVAAAIATRGTACIRDLLGDFAFVAEHAVTHETIAARDTFGVRALYYRATKDGLAFSSHATRLSESAEYDPEYIAEFILSGFDRDNRTPWRGVH